MKEKIDSLEKQRNNQDSFEKLRSLASQDEAEKPQIAAESNDTNLRPSTSKSKTVIFKNDDVNDFEPMPKLDSN